MRQPLSSRQQKVSRARPVAGRVSVGVPQPGAGDHGVAGFCPRFQRAVELIGRRWTGAIVRVLIGGPQGFNELLSTGPGLSHRPVSERLRELETEELVQREVAPGPPVWVTYRLTESGQSLEPVIGSLG